MEVGGGVFGEVGLVERGVFWGEDDGFGGFGGFGGVGWGRGEG